LKWARRSQDRVEKSPARWLIIGLAVTLALLFLGNLGRITRWLYERWLHAHPERAPDQVAAIWYLRMSRVLARRGVRKPPAATPQEFVDKIADTRLREPVARFTQVYESARFGNSADDAKKLPELYEEVELAAQK